MDVLKFMMLVLQLSDLLGNAVDIVSAGPAEIVERGLLFALIGLQFGEFDGLPVFKLVDLVAQTAAFFVDFGDVVFVGALLFAENSRIAVLQLFEFGRDGFLFADQCERELLTLEFIGFEKIVQFLLNGLGLIGCGHEAGDALFFRRLFPDGDFVDQRIQ